MNTGNGIGSKTEHWGTPEVAGTDRDTSPSMMIVCDQLPRKAQVQDSVFPPIRIIPYWLSCQMSFE